MKTYVLRVETPTGLGPWCDEKGEWNGAGSSWSLSAMSLHAHCYEWLKKQKDNKNNNWRFGFVSFQQLFRYMWSSAKECPDYEKCLDAMERCSLVISVYRAGWGGVIADDTQCVFDKKEAKLVKMLHPKDPLVYREMERCLSLSKELFDA